MIWRVLKPSLIRTDWNRFKIDEIAKIYEIYEIYEIVQIVQIQKNVQIDKIGGYNVKSQLSYGTSPMCFWEPYMGPVP